MRQLTEILHAEFAGELFLDFCNLLCVLAGNEDVIDSDGDNDVVLVVDVEAGVRIRSLEADFDQEFVELDVPNTRGLL
jgi:hypothetical protein